VIANTSSAFSCEQLQSLARVPSQPKVLAGIKKNSILSDYQEFCNAKGIQDQVSTIAKGKTLPTTSYPSYHCLIADCKIKPSTKLYYRAKDPHFDNMVIFLFKWPELYLTADDLDKLKRVNKTYREMINGILRLQFIHFASLKLPRLDYAEQTTISSKRVD
jgi:hypothetical protein